MKIFLINPPYTLWKEEYQFLDRLLGKSVPLGLLSIAAYAREKDPDISIRIMDCVSNGISLESIVQQVADWKPEIIGISVTSASVPYVKKISSDIKSRVAGSLIVAGGPHISGMKEIALDELDAIDVGVIGEGEETFADIIDSVKKRRSLDSIKGIVTRNGIHGLIKTEPRSLIKDLNTLPLPAWDLLPGFPDQYPANIFFTPGGKMASFCSSRGCSFRCTFCDQSTFGRGYRGLSADYIIGAVSTLQRQYNIRHIVFCDDNFALDRQRVLDICARMESLDKPVTWTADAHIMTVDRELLRAMKRAGCWGLQFGIESGSVPVLRSLRKDIKLEQVSNVIQMAFEEGIYTKGLFMMGTPEESPESIVATREFIMSLPLTTLNVSKFSPYPGSDIYSNLSTLLPVERPILNSMNFVMPSKYMSTEHLEYAYNEIIRAFYSQWRVRRVYSKLLLKNHSACFRLLAMIPLMFQRKIRIFIKRETR